MTLSTSLKFWNRTSFQVSNASQTKRIVTYTLLLTIPFLATLTLAMDYNGFYFALISLLNLLAMTAFYLQFPLAGRMKRIPLFSNIDWSMTQHKNVGQVLALIFLLHPVLILAPRFKASFDDGWTSLVAIVTSPNTLTGILAWLLMIAWVLLAIFKDKLAMRYETWRITHVVGFMLIAVLATAHITSIGSHSQFVSQFQWLWWSLCGLSILGTAYNYLIKPAQIKKTPFTLESIEKISSRDWQLTLQAPPSANFNFEAGQFVWLNTSNAANNLKDHPFSIASSTKSLPNLSFIIRELGDYTQSLCSLNPGQAVYVDGPYGSIDLDSSQHSKGITLIAGGAGIAPMLSLVRALADSNDPRPIRLIYAAKSSDQLVLQQDILSLEKSMLDFKQHIVCETTLPGECAYQGFVDMEVISRTIGDNQQQNWAVYICGPKPMMKPVKTALSRLNIHPSNIHFEQLSF